MSFVPASTYRLQLGGDVTFDRARELVAYLDRLGAGALYTSPVLQARSDSTHGYDVTDPTRLDTRLGDGPSFLAMSRALHDRGMELLVDVVPNHMAMSSENGWWMDVLEHGRASRYAAFFDIDWWGTGVDEKVLVPILGRPYGDALEAGEIRLVLEPEGLRAAYLHHRLPIDPAAYGTVFGRMRARGAGGELFRAAVARSAAIPPRTETARRRVVERATESDAVKREMWEAYSATPGSRRAVDALLDEWSGEPGRSGSFDRLDALLADQAYLLAHWRSALYEIDYRRFFDIPDLVSLRMQDPEVFEATHRLVLGLVRRGAVDGLRIDHVDGLADPRVYTERLRERVGDRYVVVEKILGEDEALPDWPVEGTTGYGFLRDVAELMIDPVGARTLSDAFRERTGDTDANRLVVDAKLEVMRGLFASETGALTRRLQVLARDDRHARDLPGEPLREAIEVMTACLSVYRTYIRALDVPPSDRERIEAAVDEARRRVSPDAAVALGFLRRVVLLDGADAFPRRRADAWLAFTMRWQQLSGAVMAKGLEDTALYRDVAVLARNDVGMRPAAAPLDVEAFHERQAHRARLWPSAMLTTATHDTKRGEDARMRLAVLSELAEEWLERIDRWSSWNATSRSEVGGRTVPELREEWLLYQSLVAAWPADGDADGAEVVERTVAYMRKAMREAKLATSWLDPDEAHEAAVERFIRAILEPSSRFRSDLASFAGRIARLAVTNSLAQLVLKCTSPGVPDVYQGSELWDLSLVDPDNRRAVDFTERARLLEALDGARPSELLDRWPDGGIKLLVLRSLLRLRRDLPAAFAGAYRPLAVAGAHATNVVAYARGTGRRTVVVVVPRLSAALAGWGDTAVEPPGVRTILDVVTDRSFASDRALPLRDLFSELPVAVLSPQA